MSLENKNRIDESNIDISKRNENFRFHTLGSNRVTIVTKYYKNKHAIHKDELEFGKFYKIASEARKIILRGAILIFYRAKWMTKDKCFNFYGTLLSGEKVSTRYLELVEVDANSITFPVDLVNKLKYCEKDLYGVISRLANFRLNERQ